MRATYAVLVLVFALCGGFVVSVPAHAANRSWTSCDEGKSEQESHKLRRTVAVIVSPLEAASGSLISPNEVLMSAHVVERDENEKRPVLVVTCALDEIPGIVVWVDAEHDLALIKLSKTLPDYFPMRARSSPVRGGEPIHVIGQPDRTPWAMSEGVVVHSNKQIAIRYPRRETRIHSLIVSSALTKQGGSGGALVDAEGNLLGVVVGALNGSSFAVAQSVGNFCRAYHHPLCR